ncbi:hypothetical protein C9374_013573 [Naegleria lovaniensis]|uniref:Mannosyl-oligosaccharide glucosidase n=1 Tax=Naegleria lovaniensis TaxID=51637 RepID=A0AA88GW26_NAELO|nr:uncharacterized protein C9374_013573 [Naegleria lovaniensis]KAG2392088.1 hypothetical protein C9374_013573 [Naegleria lovaniensis]
MSKMCVLSFSSWLILLLLVCYVYATSPTLFGNTIGNQTRSTYDNFEHQARIITSSNRAFMSWPSHKSRASHFHSQYYLKLMKEISPLKAFHDKSSSNKYSRSSHQLNEWKAERIDENLKRQVMAHTSLNTAVPQDFLLPRPKMYSGIQTKDSKPLYFGVAWNEYDNQQWGFKIRENVYLDDIRFNTLKVERADPLSFSKVIVVDQYLTYVRLNITTVKYTGTKNNAFAVKITGESVYDPRRKEKVDDHISVYFYVGVSEGQVNDVKKDQNSGQFVLTGYDSSSYGSFRLKTSSIKAGNMNPNSWKYDNAMDSFYFVNYTERPYYATSTIEPIISGGYGNDYTNNPSCCQATGNHFNLLPNVKVAPSSNIGIIQKVLKTPFEWIVTFDNPNANPLSDVESSPGYIDHLYEKYQQQFETDFNDKFPVLNFLKSPVPLSSSSKTSSSLEISKEDYREFAMQVLSSLIYGLSYFEGTGFYKNMSDPSQPVIVMQNRKLLSLIPNKQSFPRPFYWDEAFMEMMQVRWNGDVFEEVTRYWHFEAILDSISGWIDREQFIGDEARYQQPEWAWYGLNNQMNPPVYFITIERYAQMYDKQRVIQYFNRTGLFERMDKILNWYLTHLQAKGGIPYTYCWGGRYFDCSLDSGLDDFPRFPQVEPGEIDVDIQAWLAKAALVMSNLSKLLSKPQNMIDYYASLSAVISKNLHDLFWSESLGFYVDRSSKFGMGHHIGYIGMLPICLNLERNMTRVEQTIAKMGDPNLLFSEGHGLLSLSFKDENFEWSGQYWRGAIWAPFTYQCARGLYYYEKQYGLSSAALLRKKIQNAYINNVMKHYHVEDNSIGAVYETYHPTDGRGFNNYPFTGWSALVVLLMSEDYQ